MLDPISETPETTDSSVPRSAREEQRCGNAAARRKLEARRERKLLRKQLTEVWDEPFNHQIEPAARICKKGSTPVSAFSKRSWSVTT